MSDQKPIPSNHNGGPPLDDNPFGRDGYMKIGRAIRSHPLVGFGKYVEPADESRGFCYSRGEAWLDLLMECRYAPGEVMNKGRKMEIKPGQLLGAVSWLAHRWNWTPKTVRWFLDKLQGDAMIERDIEIASNPSTEQISPAPDQYLNGIHKGNRNGKRASPFNGNQAAVISICNYDIYQLAVYAQRQAIEQPQGQPTGQAHGDRAATEGQAHGNTLIKEEGNKGIKEDILGGTNEPTVAHAPDTGTHAEPIVPTVEKAPRAPRGKRLPEDWFLPESWGNRTLATYRVTREQVKTEADRFKNYWLAKAGKDAARVDWEATWRNWCSSNYLAWPRRTEPMEPSKEADEYGAQLDEMRATLIRDLNA